MIFGDLEEFVTAHRPCGGLISDVGDLTRNGYAVRLACSVGAAFERWVTPEAADYVLVHSRLPASPN